MNKGLSLRPVGIGVLAGVVFVTPFIGVLQYNKDFLEYQQVMGRNFLEHPYSVHPCYILFMALGLAVTGCGGFLLKGRSRRLIVSLGVTLLALPFFSGIPVTLRRELLGFDRFGFFYLIVIVATLLMLLRRYRQSSKSVLGFFVKPTKPTKPTWGLSLAALSLSSFVLAYNSTYDFKQLYDAPYTQAVSETRYLKGYHYLADHTPLSAWVLVDDGADWSKIPIGDVQSEARLSHQYWREDLFSIVARRKRYSHIRLYGSFLSDQKLKHIRVFQRMTFGLEISNQKDSNALYALLFNEFKPEYIFWRREERVPRGQGLVLKSCADVVYTDEHCEIWKLRYPNVLDVFKFFPAKTQEAPLH
jgi:hypothetical protein